MSLARRAVLQAASRTKPVVFTTQCRAASSSHGDDHHHHQEDSTVYPPEGFANTFWRNVAVISLIGAVIFKYAPEPSDNVYLTRWMSLYSTPSSTSLALNAKHTAQQQAVSDDTLLVTDAHLAPVHRFRYPQSLVQSSSFLNVVGGNVDMKDVVAKRD